MSRRWLIGVAVFALVVAACGASPASAATGSKSLAVAKVPPGWTSHNYGRAAISVPSSWPVQPAGSCVLAFRPTGVLIVGAPVGSCHSIPAPTATVTIEDLPADLKYRRPPFASSPITVNGVTVYVGAGPPGTTRWAAPALGVEVVGTGPDALKVLHTLGRPVSTFTAGPKSVVLEIGDGCLSAVTWLDAHASSTVPGKDSVVAVSCTPTQLRAALSSLHPGSPPQEIAQMEQFMVVALCPNYQNMKLCTS